MSRECITRIAIQIAESRSLESYHASPTVDIYHSWHVNTRRHTKNLPVAGSARDWTLNTMSSTRN